MFSCGELRFSTFRWVCSLIVTGLHEIHLEEKIIGAIGKHFLFKLVYNSRTGREGVKSVKSWEIKGKCALKERSFSLASSEKSFEITEKCSCKDSFYLHVPSRATSIKQELRLSLQCVCSQACTYSMCHISFDSPFVNSRECDVKKHPAKTSSIQLSLIWLWWLLD